MRVVTDTAGAADAAAAAALVEVVGVAESAHDAAALCTDLAAEAALVAPDGLERLADAVAAAAVVAGAGGAEALPPLAAALAGRGAAGALLAADRAATAGLLHAGPAQTLTAAALRLQAAIEFDELTPELARDVAGELQETARALREALAGLADDRVQAGVAEAALAARVRGAAPSAVLTVELDEATAAGDVAALATVLEHAAATAGAGATVRVTRRGDRLCAHVHDADGALALALALPTAP